MKHHFIAFVLPVLAACTTPLTEKYPCGTPQTVCVQTSEVPVDNGIVDFETPCDGKACTIKAVEGSFDFAPSFHPADHALRIAPNTTIEVMVATIGDADGASVSLNARCDEGGILSFVGDDDSDIPSARAVLANTSTWGRHDWVLRPASILLASLSAARTRRSESKLRFVNRGTAHCLIDRLVLSTTALICARQEVQQATCERPYGSGDPGRPDTRSYLDTRRDPEDLGSDAEDASTEVEDAGTDADDAAPDSDATFADVGSDG